MADVKAEIIYSESSQASDPIPPPGRAAEPQYPCTVILSQTPRHPQAPTVGPSSNLLINPFTKVHQRLCDKRDKGQIIDGQSANHQNNHRPLDAGEHYGAFFRDDWPYPYAAAAVTEQVFTSKIQLPCNRAQDMNNSVTRGDRGMELIYDPNAIPGSSVVLCSLGIQW